MTRSVESPSDPGWMLSLAYLGFRYRVKFRFLPVFGVFVFSCFGLLLLVR